MIREMSGKCIVAWSDIEEMYCITDKNHDGFYWDSVATGCRRMSNDELDPIGFRQMTEAEVHENQESVVFEEASHVPEEGQREGKAEQDEDRMGDL
jgi:hypothetical protein